MLPFTWTPIWPYSILITKVSCKWEASGSFIVHPSVGKPHGVHPVLGAHWGPFPGETRRREESSKGIWAHERRWNSQRGLLFSSGCLNIVTIALSGPTYLHIVSLFLWWEAREELTDMLALVPGKAQPEEKDLCANLFLESTIPGSKSER